MKRAFWLWTTAAVALCISCTGSSDGIQDSSGITNPSLAPNGIVAEVARLWQTNNMDLVRYDYVFQVEVEEKVRLCMAELGFEYFPAPASRPLIAISELTDLYESAAQFHPSSAEFREAYGYGVSTLDAYLHVAQPLSTDQIVYEGGLSDAQLQAYTRSLWGSDSQIGCVESVVEEADFEYTTTDDEWRAYNGALEHALDRAMAVESYVSAEKDWSKCAHDLGYSFERPADVPLYFSMQLSEILVEPDDVEVLVTGDLPPDYDLSSSGDSDSVYDPAVLAALQSEEIATARRLNRCDNAFVEATQGTLNRIAMEELADTPFALG